MTDDPERIWRATWDALDLEAGDPRATRRPPPDDDAPAGETLAPHGPAGETLAPDLPGETIAPVDAPALVGERAPVRATHRTMVPQGDGAVVVPAPEAAYVLGAALGQGGMGIVYQARQTVLRRSVALKMALDDKRSGARRRFVAEAQVTAALDHPNIVPVHDLVETPDGKLALSMKLVEGVPWTDHLNAKVKPLVWHVQILVSVCQAVAFAHRRGILHADLKPDNVMIGEYGEVLVMDWGCALYVGDAPRDQAPVAVRPSDVKGPFGSPAYMAPELALGEGLSISKATDVSLLGAILYEVLEGRPPNLRNNLYATLHAAAKAATPLFSPSTPQVLAATCRKALSREPEQRHRSVDELRDELLHWLETRESVRLCDDARETFLRCVLSEEADDPEGRNALYIDYEAALSGFEQAVKLWPANLEAAAGERQARARVVDLSLRHGDLGLAEAHAVRIQDEAAQSEALARVHKAQASRRSSARQATWLRVGLALAVLAALGGTSLGLGAALIQWDEAARSAEVAEARLAEIRRLSDVQILSELDLRQQALWPALPDKIPDLQAWLDEARALEAREPLHRAAREALQAQGTPSAKGLVFADPAARWEYDTLSALVSGLSTLASVQISAVQARLDFAQSVQRRSIDDHAADWTATTDAIAASPLYGGLRVAPQLGLVPLGADPDSGLFEFAHLASGEPPLRGPDGRLQLTDDTGVVLVLLPGGRFRQGATATPGGVPFDPAAKRIEGPPADVDLGPWFMAKYEFTQAQWARVAASNPSAYPPGTDLGGPIVSGRNPVEQVRWQEATDALRRLDLSLPTEAQWEYASRAGTQTVFFTGPEPQTLQGFANLADRTVRAKGGPESWQVEDFLDDGYVIHAPVGTFRPNPFGLHDTVGNVWEWCRDSLGRYTDPVQGPDAARLTAPDAPHVFRGGGFRASRVHARSADRYPLYAGDYQAYDVGFRASRPVR